MKTIWKVLLGLIGFGIFIGVALALVIGVTSVIQYRKLSMELASLKEDLAKEPVVVEEPEVEEPEVVEKTTVVDMAEITIDFGAFGEYRAVYDSNREMYTLGFWNENCIRTGNKNLADLKRDGGSITFTIPSDGWINNSAGELFVDGIPWNLGNYGENAEQETLISAGSTITISYEPGNDSAGFQLWFAN